MEFAFTILVTRPPCLLLSLRAARLVPSLPGMKVPNAVLATFDVTSLYTNILPEEGIDVVCRYYEDHYEQKLPIPTSHLRELILEENSFKFNEKHFVQTHSIAMGNKMSRSLSFLFSWRRTWKNDC